jgi:hypothetical protein
MVATARVNAARGRRGTGRTALTAYIAVNAAQSCRGPGHAALTGAIRAFSQCPPSTAPAPPRRPAWRRLDGVARRGAATRQAAPRGSDFRRRG